MLVSFLHADLAVSSAEKRRLAKMPNLHQSGSLAEYFAGVSAYVDDHFGFRELMISAHNRLMITIGEASTDRVIIGTANWNFYKTTDPLTLAGIDRGELRTNLERRANYFAERTRRMNEHGIPYLFTIIPNKMMVYPEFLPAKYRWAEFDTSLRYFENRLTPLAKSAYFDMTSFLATAKANQSTPIYYRNDTHWNSLGAYLASSAILEEINIRNNLTVLASPHSFTSKQKVGGDVANYLGLNDTLKSTEPATNVPDCVKRKNVKELRRGLSKVYCGKGTHTLLYLGDSFTANLYPFLGENVDTLYMAYEGLPHEELEQLIKETKPTIIIEGMVQRNIPKTLLSRDR